MDAPNRLGVRPELAELVSMYCLAVDTGGTFTDFAALHIETGEIKTHKVRSVPHDPSRAIIEGLDEMKCLHAIEPSKIVRFIFGTTVATNAVLERKGAHTAIITTKGMRDVIEIQRQYRQRLFDLSLRKPEPFVRRRDRIEVDERLAADGSAVVLLQDRAIESVLEALDERGVESVAVCLLFSFVNSQHERLLKAAINGRHPNLFVTISSDVCPEFREFERTSTTTMNAYVMPAIERLMVQLGSALAESQCSADVRVMQSNGGLMNAEQTLLQPVNTLLSGPAGGAIGAVKIATIAGSPNVIGIDMGGTSVDICLVENGRIQLVPESHLGGFPLRVPQIDIHTIGAGGGSIARLDRGTLQVGPESAGADPGPVCYGRGNSEPTSTDAAVCLGFIDPDYFLGGSIPLDAAASRHALATQIGAPLGLGTTEAAHAVMRIQVANIVAGIRGVTVEKGLDPREFALLPFGGAGALYAGLIAEELGIRRIVIPIFPSVLSAIGMLTSDVKYTRSITRLTPAAVASGDLVKGMFEELETQLAKLMGAERLPREKIEIERSCDLRYLGQAFELNVCLPQRSLVDDSAVRQLVETFHQEHQRLYGYSVLDEPVELVTFRITGVGRLAFPGLLTLGPDREASARAPKGYRQVYFEPPDGCSAPVFDRQGLPVGVHIEGPAVIEDAGASIPLFPGHRMSVDSIGNLLVEVPLQV